MCVFSACNNSLACQGVCCSRRTGPEEGFQADLATLECAAFQPSTTPSQASPTNPGSDPHTRGLQCTHTREHTKWQLYIFFFKMASWWQVGGILAWAGSHPDTPRLLWRILCTLLCTYLLFIGALPYWQPVPDPIDQWGRSLALLSDTRCRCLKREIKLVGAAAKTHMVAGLAGKENPADFPRGWGMRMSSMGNEGVCKLMTVSEKFVCLSPRWWSLSKGWQTGVLRSLKKGGLTCRDWLECTMNWFRSVARSPTWLSYHLITSEILWYESFRWNEGLLCHSHENVVNLLSYLLKWKLFH